MDIMSASSGIQTIFFIMIGGFMAGFVDSIAGGGGLISLPILLAAGMTPHLALGTNKFSATFGACMSARQFIRAGKTDMSLLRRLIPCSFLGAVAGCVLMLYISAKWLQPIIIIALIGSAFFVFFRRHLGAAMTYSGASRTVLIKSSLMAFVLGMYDGFIGPGTGTFLIVFFAMLGFDFVLAAGNAKVLNLISNLTSFVIFVACGKVYYVYGILMAVCIFWGAFFGARLAIRKGIRFVRYVMLAVTCALIIKLIIQYFVY